MKRTTFLALVISGCTLLLGAQSAFAVNEFCDSVSGAPGTGVCTVSTSHPPTTPASGAFTIDRNLHITGTGKLIAGATGIDITITQGDFLMDNGALINATANPTGGPITVTLLDGDVDLAPGSIIRSNGNSGGAIKITTTATHTIDIDGLVESEGTSSGTGSNQAPGGGTITIVAGCGLTVSDDGVISSRGRDPGADLVHLQGCTVIINGLVESTGTGHALPNIPGRENHCNLDPAAHPLGSNQFYTACVEIWGDTVTINSILPHKGEVNVNGTRDPSRAWIDIFARRDITIVNDATGPFSVHANAAVAGPTSNSFGGLVTVKSSIGKITTNGLAISANATGVGSNGGFVIVQAGGAGALGDITLNTSTIQATGPNGSNTAGGHIFAKSFNGSVTGAAPGVLSAAGGLAQATPVPGTVMLEGCLANPAASYTGIVIGTRTDSVACGGTPSFPVVPHWNTLQSATQFIAAAATCATTQCGGTCLKSGLKFNDVNNNHVNDGEPVLGGWEIKLLNSTQTAVLATTTTDAVTGLYKFEGLAPGTYVVCETPQATWNQTFPVVGAGIVACANGTLGYQFTLAFVDNVCQDTGNDFGNNRPSHKSGMKFNDVNGNGIKDPGDSGISGWPINLYALPANTLSQTTNTNALGNYTFTIPVPGAYRVCEGQKAGVTSTETFPNAGTLHGGETIVNTCPAPNVWGYEFTLLTGGTEIIENDFGNHSETAQCPEDPKAVLTKSVSKPGSGVPNFDTLQAAYDAAVNGDVIGMFGNTKENVTLGGAKTLKITQCTSARITAADNSLPVWNITSTGKLTIVGPDSVGGNIGWLIANPSGGPHILKSVRANGASVWGIRINSDKNEVSWNDVSGNGGPGGILVAGNSNILKGGTTGPNNGDGIKITGNSNSLSGATVESNTGNGVNVTGSSNTIKSNKANSNTLAGFLNAAGAGNNYSGNSSNTGGKENGGAEYQFTTAGVNGGSNRADGTNVPKTTAPTKCPDFATAGSVCE